MAVLTPDRIARALGCPISNVILYWPLFLDELKERGVNKLSLQVAILATIGVEAGKFLPVTEAYWLKQEARERYFFRMYDPESPSARRRKVAKALGNTKPGDGVKYHGRGFVQITGRGNYRAYGKRLGIPLEAIPDRALDGKDAVRIMVDYFLTHGIDVWADRAFRTDDDEHFPEDVCTAKIRMLVNGGLTHYDKFVKHWDRLKQIAQAG